MAIMLSKTYAAFKAAGVSDSEAQAAAEEIASYENRLSGIESRLSVLTWMVSFNLIMTAGTLWRVLSHGALG